MRALSVRIRNWCARSACESEIKLCLAPPKVNVTRLYFSPKSPTQKGFMVQKSWKSERWKISHLGTFNFETLKPPKLRLIQNRLLFYPTPLTSFPLSVRVSAAPHPPPLDKGGRRPLTDGGAYGRRPLTDGGRLRTAAAYGRRRLRTAAANERRPLTDSGRLRTVEARTYSRTARRYPLHSFTVKKV